LVFALCVYIHRAVVNYKSTLAEELKL
jgi:hypothetical protein